MRMKRTLWMICGLLVAAAAPAMAGKADVLKVAVTSRPDGLFTFSVTLRHADEGWDHYADQWDVESVDGKTVYGRRVLYHPHVDEQPFARFLSEVKIPEDVREVNIRARDKRHGYGGVEMRVRLPGR